MMDESLMPETGGRQPGVLAAMPRRHFVEASADDSSLSQMRFVSFKANQFRVLASFLRGLQLILYFAANVFFDILRGKDSPDQRAIRLRRAFEHAGGSFVKLGIHLSM